MDQLEKIKELQDQRDEALKEIKKLEEGFREEHCPYVVGKKYMAPQQLYLENPWLRGKEMTITSVDPALQDGFWYWIIYGKLGTHGGLYHWREEIAI